MTTEEIKLYLYTNKVCVVTNSISLPSTLLLPSLKTYIDYLPLHNFWVIPGFFQNNMIYGINAFAYMLQYMLQNDHFDYVIYLDEDVFIKDFSLLIDEFEIFKKSSNCCLAGIQDGGSLCHRNHSKFLVNTFISFWNIKMYREKNIDFNDFSMYIEQNYNHPNNFKNWYTELVKNTELFKKIEKNADIVCKKAEIWRKNNIKTADNKAEYCGIVENDKNNEVEQHQVPYSFDDYTATYNFEPYYVIEQYLINKTNAPIYYLFATDFCDEEYKDKCDISGLTTAVRTYDEKLIAVHTWFSRAYTKWPTNEMQLAHTRRINSIIKEFSKI